MRKDLGSEFVNAIDKVDFKPLNFNGLIQINRFGKRIRLAVNAIFNLNR